MAKVGIVMGSDSDLEVMSKAAEMLEKFGIDYELTVISAHRMPDVFFDYAKTAEKKGFKVIIAGAILPDEPTPGILACSVFLGSLESWLYYIVWNGSLYQWLQI